MRARLSRRTRRGNFFVESALILFVFLVMLIGILDFGYFLFIHQSLVERARAAVRYGVTNAFDTTAIKNVVLYSQPTQPEGQSPFLGLTAAMVDVQRLDATTDADRIRVTVSGYPVSYFSPLMASVRNNLPITVTLPYEYR